ncbi:MAG TPA: signal peptidase I [Xanthobacteraceae bacterium]|nr:signal peptidase I [Xanthobacteraceae bacterium]
MAARSVRSLLWGLLAVVLACLGVTTIVSLRSFGVQTFSLPSGSMEPTLLPGDYIAVNKSSYGYSRYSLPFAYPLFQGRIFAAAAQRGDLVVFRVPRLDQDYVKRIIGLPGDRVQMRGGQLYINGKAVARERAADFALNEGPGFPQHVRRWRETLPNGVSYETLDLEDNGPLDDTREFTVPPGNYFVLGDNRDNSLDSRMPEQLGYIPAENLIGRIVMIFFSVDANGVPRTDRIGLVPQ